MWSEVEDQLLLNAVQKFGTHNWGLVAASVSGRTRKQCRERWAGKLNPELAKEPWSNDEDNKLIELHKKLGNKWALISVHLAGRSPIMLKNRWGYIMRHLNQSKTHTIVNDDIAQNHPLDQPLINNEDNNNNEIIQQNENIKSPNNDQNMQFKLQTIIPPNTKHDDANTMTQQISRPPPFSLDS